jgi:8-oxo-dGTP diphosphatase
MTAVVEVALAVAVRGGAVLVGRRAPGSHLAGAWEFPGGKIDDGEEPAAAALRELREETALEGNRAEPLVVHIHDYEDRSVRLHAFLVREPAGEGLAPWTWVGIEHLADLAMPPANGPIVRAIRWRLRA